MYCAGNRKSQKALLEKSRKKPTDIEPSVFTGSDGVSWYNSRRRAKEAEEVEKIARQYSIEFDPNNPHGSNDDREIINLDECTINPTLCCVIL